MSSTFQSRPSCSGPFVRDDLDAGGLRALEHRLAHLDVQRHQADHGDLLGDQVFQQLHLLRRIDVGGADHRRVDVEVLRPLLDALLHGVEPRDAGDLHHRDHGRRCGECEPARQARRAGQGCAAQSLECLASVHAMSPWPRSWRDVVVCP
jgi:hypothetical protein